MNFSSFIECLRFPGHPGLSEFTDRRIAIAQITAGTNAQIRRNAAGLKNRAVFYYSVNILGYYLIFRLDRDNFVFRNENNKSRKYFTIPVRFFAFLMWL